MTSDGKPILTKKDAEIFKEYLEERSAWMSEMYIKYLQSHGQQVPEISEDDYLL